MIALNTSHHFRSHQPTIRPPFQRDHPSYCQWQLPVLSLLSSCPHQVLPCGGPAQISVRPSRLDGVLQGCRGGCREEGGPGGADQGYDYYQYN